ncbi:Mesoderm posterior protein 1 [Merluccius polli]|uniref:Mesoderm posterior protein 1 n=1 Tax=Merluccius polli TaxID=89951 RepID=A0AA47NCX3_MERPO|nr:Mesoderm posterior protein 1 [Merluccius polli]
MDISTASLLACGLAYGWTSPGTDSDLSLSSPETLSPLGYLDSSFSPSSSSDPQHPSHRSPLDPTATRTVSLGSGSTGHRSPSSSGSGRKPGRRGRVRSKQRESASEKEKMRMRDLTKALHHLRSFLPTSLAPAGQALTKIETLRLAIRYIGHLSAQLGHDQEVLLERSPSEEASSPDTLRYFQSLYSSATGQWTPGPGQCQTQLPGQTAAVHPGNCSYGIDLHRYNSGQCGAAPQGAVFGTNMEINLLSPPATHHSHCQDPQPGCQAGSARFPGAEVTTGGATSHLQGLIGRPLHCCSSQISCLPSRDTLTQENSSLYTLLLLLLSAAMDVSYCSAALLPEIHSPGPFDYEALLGQSCWAAPACDQASDPGYFSATGSSLSPTSSVDSFSFSPAHLSAAGPEPDTLDCLLSSLNRLTGVTTEPAISCCSTRTQKSSSPAKTTTTTTSTTRRSWSRFPGRKRQTASEREKLRMRDLTKSLNHLRSYLPASVAPVEQTLTKIETLRLTMRYISHLSAQLGHGQEVPETRGTSHPTQQNPAFQPILEQPNVGYVPEEPQHHYQHVAMDTAEWACGAQHQNQTTQHILLQNYQGSGSFCSPWLSGQNWTSPDLLQQTTFSS